MAVGLYLVVIRVSDLQRALGFYEVLGLRFSEEQHGDGPKHLAAEVGDVIFEMYPLETGRQPQASGWDSACRRWPLLSRQSKNKRRVLSQGDRALHGVDPQWWRTRTGTALRLANIPSRPEDAKTMWENLVDQLRE